LLESFLLAYGEIGNESLRVRQVRLQSNIAMRRHSEPELSQLSVMVASICFPS